VICSLHFLPTDIIRNGLRPGAMPFSFEDRDKKLMLVDHQYACSSEITAAQVKDLQNTIQNLNFKVNQVSVRKRKLEVQNKTLQSVLENIKNDISDEKFENISHKAAKIPQTLFNIWSKKMKFQEENPTKAYKSGVAYTDDVREFALSLHNVSPAAYR
jgi:hypothetical protein